MSSNETEKNWVEESRNRFSPHTLTNEAAVTVQALREWFVNLDIFLARELPEGRERSLARTHLETASMWATKAIALQAPVVKVEPGPEWTTANPHGAGSPENPNSENCRDLTTAAQKIRSEQGLPPLGARRS